MAPHPKGSRSPGRHIIIPINPCKQSGANLQGVVPNPHRRRRRTPGPERGPGVNEVSFRARPHHNVHITLGVDAGATGPR
jgi:hypothetical protein